MDSKRATLMRIFVDESDRHAARPLFDAIVDTLRENGFAGATVLKGIEGYGPSGEVHAARSVDFSANLPLLIEVAEEEEKVRSVVPLLRSMMRGGLITLEKIDMRIVRQPS